MKKVTLFLVLVAACEAAESGLAFSPMSTCATVDGLCTDVLLPGITEAEHLRTDGAHVVFLSAGDIVVLSMEEGTMIVIESETVRGWSTPSVSDGRVAAKHMLPDGTVEYAVFAVTGERLGAIHIEDASAGPTEFAAMPLELAGDYLAYFEPTDYGRWIFMVSELVETAEEFEFRSIEVSTEPTATEFTLDRDGRILCVLWNREEASFELDLFTPFWDLEVPWKGAPVTIVRADYGIMIHQPQLSGDMVLFEITVVASYSAFASGVFLTDLDQSGYDWALDAQGVWGREVVLGSLALSESLIAWLDGRVDSERPAIALRPYVLDEHHLVLEEDYAIYPSSVGQITEFQVVGREVFWLLAEPDGMSLSRTTVVE